MKLEKILDNVNSLEKNSFLKIVDSIKSSNPKNNKDIDKILSESSDNLKSVDSINIVKIFSLIKNEFIETIKSEFVNTTSQLDILIDIIIKDGNGILKPDWFARLYEKELASIKKRTKHLKTQLDTEKSEIEDSRKREIKVVGKINDVKIFDGVFQAVVLETHILKSRLKHS